MAKDTHIEKGGFEPPSFPSWEKDSNKVEWEVPNHYGVARDARKKLEKSEPESESDDK